jgi:spermidine synthase
MTIKRPTDRLVTLLTIVFFFSGFASLVYQVVWQRLLTLHYGVSSISTTLIVGVYMAGLGLGGLAGGYLAEKVRRKVQLYFWIELGIGVFGLFSLGFVGYLGRATAGSPYFLSALYMFLFLSIPTFLMGITLPLLTKIFNRVQQNFFRTVSFLYFINTIGAACGAFITSYFLISFFGLDIALYAAAVVDLILAFMVWLASRMNGSVIAPAGDQASAVETPSGGLGRWAYVIVFITGFLALGYEIVWYRLISVLVKDSPYAFSTILAIYLLGIALGSLSANKYLQRHPGADRRSLFFTLQFLIGLFTLIVISGYFYLTRDTGFGILTHLSFNSYLHPDPELLRHLPRGIGSFALLYSYLDIFLWPLLFLFIPTFLMGAAFPLISSLALVREDDEGKTVGTVYFYNIMGNVAGSVLTGFVILPTFGSEPTLLFLALANVLAIFLVVKAGRLVLSPAGRAAIFAVIFLAGVLIFPRRGDLYRLIHPLPNDRQMILNEGVDGLVVSYYTDGPTTDYINGLEHGLFGADWYFAWVAAAAGYAPGLEDVLVIGFGSGTFPAVLEKMDGLGKMTVVELSPTLMRNHVSIPFYKSILENPKMKLVIEDGRRYLLQTDDKYDVILMDPLRTTTAFANNLHSRQFFELAGKHLKPGGVLLIGGLNEEWVVPKTIASVFPYVQVFEQFVVASDNPLVMNGSRMDQILASLPAGKGGQVAGYMRKTYRGDQNFILDAAREYPANEEWKPNTEYYLGIRIMERLHILKPRPPKPG